MTAQCQSCSAPTDLFICSRCCDTLRTTLADLPGWLAALREAAIGQTRMGDSGRGGTRREPFNGEDEIPVVDATKLQAQFLAVGRVNARASDRIDAVRNSLTTWVRHIAESREIAFVRVGFIGPLLANHVRMAATTPALIAFLRMHVQAIACDEAAGECLYDLTNHVRAIERIVDRPIATRFLGNCPTWHERTRRVCGTELRCREGVIQVTCPTCRQPHNTDRLQLLLMNDLERKDLTLDKILELMRTVVPVEFRVTDRTIRRWRNPGKNGEAPKLKPRGYRRADGRRVINRHSDDDEPLFRWSDITRLRSEKPTVKAQ